MYNLMVNVETTGFQRANERTYCPGLTSHQWDASEKRCPRNQRAAD